MVDFVVDFVVGAFSVKWKKSLKFHKKSKVDVVADKKIGAESKHQLSKSVIFFQSQYNYRTFDLNLPPPN